MNTFVTKTATIARVFEHVAKNDGKETAFVGVEAMNGFNTVTIFTPATVFERRFGFRMSPIAKQAIIAGTVSYSETRVNLGEEFTYFEGAEEVHKAESDLVLHNVKAVTINPMFIAALNLMEPVAATQSKDDDVYKKDEVGPKDEPLNNNDFEQFSKPAKGAAKPADK